MGGSTVSMGTSAVWVVGGHIHVLIVSIATYDWADEQYRSMGLDPTKAKFVGVKNMMNFRLGYKNVTNVETHAIVLDIPGPTPPTLHKLPFRRVQRPIWFPPAFRGGEEAESTDQAAIRLLGKQASHADPTV